MKIRITLAGLLICITAFSQTDDAPAMRMTIGAGLSLANQFNHGNIDEFYQRIAPDPSYLPDDGANGFKFLSIGFQSGGLAKPIIGLDLQYILTHPSRAIWGEDTGFGYATDVYFSAKFLNVALKFGLPIGAKNYFVIEPGLDIGFMKGKIGIYNSLASYTEEFIQERALGVGGHLAGGMDIPLGKSFALTLRAGYRFIKIDETHADSSSSTGYSSLYVNGVDGDIVQVDWSGTYANFGILLLIGDQ